ncbi:hypothetical protein PR202_gb17380 [Eleusine coracana subsp. coracana]|uniref:GH16 domain-containing protein n=1 Tax=Eleusine coracana subsp. coracana TaxID=191504 RepID=A0AAV5F3D9_ELECO|nr:hypothetical protein PR202_gb17380 [Eleusine coracana subsp. coracana]
MTSKLCPWLLLAVFLAAVAALSLTPVEGAATVGFDENYVVQWGADGRHLVSHAGFRSKSMYAIRVLPLEDEAACRPENGERDEVDFEFLGDKDGKPVTLQTNVFVKGRGDREQRLHLWFDPAADFHDYKILWNPDQLM